MEKDTETSLAVGQEYKGHKVLKIHDIPEDCMELSKEIKRTADIIVGIEEMARMNIETLLKENDTRRQSLWEQLQERGLKSKNKWLYKLDEPAHVVYELEPIEKPVIIKPGNEKLKEFNKNIIIPGRN